MKNDLLPAIEGGIPTRESFLIFGKPQIEETDIQEVVDTLRSGWIGTGPRTSKFEELLKDYVSAKYSIAVNSCTAGLHLSLLAAGVKAGDEVITTPMTFGATANVIEHAGAIPVFADIEVDSQNINPIEIKKKISSKTKAIIPVHMAGRPCKMDEILLIAKENRLKVIEDAAHALGAEYKGKKIGSIGDFTSFSFYVTKNLTTGEGGAVTTNDPNYAEFIRLYSLHGMSKGAWKRYSAEKFKHYLIMAPGYKYNMTDLQAALGIQQFKRFDSNQKRRKDIWEYFNESFKGLPLITPKEPEPNTKHGYHLYTILAKTEELKVNRDTLEAAFHSENIGIGTHFIALHLHPFYAKKYGYRRGMFPNAEFVSDRTISLPFSAALSDEDVEDVIRSVKKIFTYYREHKSNLLSSKVPSLRKILNENEIEED